MSNLKIIDKFQILSTDTGEITEIFDITVPIKNRIDSIGYLKAQIEARIDLIKKRKKDLDLDKKLLEDLLNEVKEATIEGINNTDAKIVRGLETKAWLKETTVRELLVNESNVPDEMREFTIEISKLTEQQKNDIYGLVWEQYGIPTAKIKISSKVNVNVLPIHLVETNKKTIVSFSRAGAVVNE